MLSAVFVFASVQGVSSTRLDDGDGDVDNTMRMHVDYDYEKEMCKFHFQYDEICLPMLQADEVPHDYDLGKGSARKTRCECREMHYRECKHWFCQGTDCQKYCY